MIRGFSQPQTYDWPSGDGKEVAVLSTSVQELADELDSSIFFGEDSLGVTREIGVQLPSGRLVMFLEHENAPELGVNVLVDLADDAGEAIAELRRLSAFIADRVEWVASE